MIQNMKLDIFRLYVQNEDTRPRSWICVKGKNLQGAMESLLNEIINTTPPKEYVSLKSPLRPQLIDCATKKVGNQRILARQLGVTQQTVSKWRCGVRKIPMHSLRKISELSKVNWKNVAGNIEKMKKDPKTGLSLYFISKTLSKELKCGADLIWGEFNAREWYAVPVILELLKLWKNVLNKDKKDFENKKLEIQEKIKLLKLNNAASKPIKAILTLNETLCKISGAHAADGNLALQLRFSSKNKQKLHRVLTSAIACLKRQTKISWDKSRRYWVFQLNLNPSEHKLLRESLDIEKEIYVSLDYKITIRDEYKNSIQIFCNWIKEAFGLSLTPKHCKGKNEWHVIFKNKMVARYFLVFLEFPYSKKSSIVNEPLIIRQSKSDFRKAFAKGVMMFDGSVNLQGQVILMLNSKCLLDSVFNIITTEIPKSCFEYGTNKRGEHFFRSIKPDKNLGNKLLDYFENDTEKWLRLYGIVNGFGSKVANFEDAINTFNNFDRKSKVTFANILLALNALNSADIRTLKNHLMRMSKLPKLSATQIRNKLQLLTKNNIIFVTPTRNEVGGTKYVYSLNPNIAEWMVPSG